MQNKEWKIGHLSIRARGESFVTRELDDREKIYYDCKKILDIFIANISKN